MKNKCICVSHFLGCMSMINRTLIIYVALNSMFSLKIFFHLEKLRFADEILNLLIYNVGNFLNITLLLRVF